MGGTGIDNGFGVSVDGSGNVYVTGSFFGTVDFDEDFGGGIEAPKTSADSFYIFVTRVNSDGAYGWTRRMGGTGIDNGRGVSVDGSGNVYVTGFFYGTVDFDEDFGGGIEAPKTSAGVSDIFVTRINSDGTYGWTRRMGGLDYDFGYRVSVDGSGKVYVTGLFRGTVDFDEDFGGGIEDPKTSAGIDDIFVTRISQE
jgi:hypothetical protein